MARRHLTITAHIALDEDAARSLEDFDVWEYKLASLQTAVQTICYDNLDDHRFNATVTTVVTVGGTDYERTDPAPAADLNERTTP